ncbi:hypothetical protein [Spiroplasma endosymbiont of Nebria brevicollis]|uniref:hypothetical protein n=1 Tax=Spiroplasma endosymbiont of Nebria brevicollis TaxID=3066284 RepID=UPI00313ECD67
MSKLVFKRMYIYKLHRSELLDHKEGRPAILLKYKNQKSLIWAGTHKCDLKTTEIIRLK